MSPRRKRTPPPGEELTQRQQFLLGLVVREYVAAAQPVGSQRLVERYRLPLSAATVRNELAALSQKGYLTQPHTSAGRVPTEKGYRYVIGRLVERSDLPAPLKHTIAHQFYQAEQNVGQWMQLAASVLARQARAASLVTAPHPEEARYKHLELISLRPRQALLVLVLQGGEIRQRLLHLDAPWGQPRLSALADRFNRRYRGQRLAEVRMPPLPEPGLPRQVWQAVSQEMEESERRLAAEVYSDGLQHVLNQPEFARSEAARRALAMLGDRAFLEKLLRRVVAQAEIGAVQVLVGGDAPQELHQCAVILARYGAPGLASGMVGVVGPMRMPYATAIPTVRFVANLLSEMMRETLVE